MPRGEPSYRIAPDRAPEERIIVHVVIVAGQHVRPDRWDGPVEDQQTLVAMGAKNPWLESRRAQVGGWRQRAGIVLRRRRAVLDAADRVNAEHVLLPPLPAVIALGLAPLLEEVWVGRIA